MAEEGFSWVRGWKKKLDEGGWWHSFELPDGRRIEGVNSVESLRLRLSHFPLPEDLRGARVLDIGAWDGWFTFEMERRGAEVVAVDCWDNPRFRQIRAALNSRADYRILDVYDLTPATVGRFDIVLFMGVLYHLKHPLLALERVCALTTNLACVDSFILKPEHHPGEILTERPLMEFFEVDELGGQTDNWCAPNLACLMAMCRTAGFARVEHRATLSYGAEIACYRTWLPVAGTQPAPELLAASRDPSGGINFQTRFDEYVAIQFRATGQRLALDDVRPTVGGYGVRPIFVAQTHDGTWRANFKLPPGLSAGWQDLTLRIGDSAESGAVRVAVDLPPATAPAAIEGVSDGTTWEPGLLRLSRGNVLAIWAAGLADNADQVNTSVSLGGERLRVDFLEPPRAGAARQINVFVPPEVPEGMFELCINGGAAVCLRVER